MLSRSSRLLKGSDSRKRDGKNAMGVVARCFSFTGKDHGSQVGAIQVGSVQFLASLIACTTEFAIDNNNMFDSSNELDFGQLWSSPLKVGIRVDGWE